MENMTPDAITFRPPPRTYGRLATGAQQRRAILTRAVQLQVIPRLLQRPAPLVLTPQVETLATLSLQADSRAATQFVADALEGGMPAGRIMLDLLGPAAALLGQHWVDDLCSFADVTIGCGHLHAAARTLRPAFFRDAAPRALDAPRALLAPIEGEQHCFGLSMLAAFFGRAGWQVGAETVGCARTLRDAVRTSWVDLVGLSASSDLFLEPLRIEIAALRAASRNPALRIMVGGLPFTQEPGLARALGADATALDAEQAVRTANHFLHIRPAPC